jgi:hypothetical protein
VLWYLQSHHIASHGGETFPGVNTNPLGMTIEPSRAAELFDQMVAWRPMSGDRQDPLTFTRSFNEGVQARIGDALSRAIGPAMAASDRTPARGEALLSFASTIKSWRSLPALAEFLSEALELRDAVIVALRRGLIGTDAEHASASAFALVPWATLAKIHRRSVTSDPRRHRAFGLVRQVRRHCNITGCGISIAVSQFLPSRRAVLRSRLVVFGGSRRLCGQYSN